MSEQTAGSDRQKVTLTDRFLRSEAAAGEAAPEDYLLLNLNTGQYYGVGIVGGFILERLDGEQDLQAIAEEITRHFEVDHETASADLLDFVSWLQELGLANRA